MSTGDLYEIIQDLVEALSPRNHCERFVADFARSGVRRTRAVAIFESSVAALSESVARQQVPRVAECTIVVVSLAKSSLVVEEWERAAIVLCSPSLIALEKVPERLKHLANRLLDGIDKC